MIPLPEVHDHFTRMLDEAGFDATRPDARLVWETFKRFAAMPVECEEDDLLFQCGLYTRDECFEFNFTRQFSVRDEDGEYGGMEHLSCSLFYEPTEELRSLKTNLWDFDLLGGGAAGQVVSRMLRLEEPAGSSEDGTSLSRREVEVLKLVGEGHSNSDIAQTLHITPGTAKNHVSRIVRKLEVGDRLGAALYARKRWPSRSSR